MPSLANTASKLEAYFESRSLIRNRKVLHDVGVRLGPHESMERLLALPHRESQ